MFLIKSVLVVSFIALPHSILATTNSPLQYTNPVCFEIDLEELDKLTLSYPLTEEIPVFTIEQWEKFKELGEHLKDKKLKDKFFRVMRVLTFMLKNYKDRNSRLYEHNTQQESDRVDGSNNTLLDDNEASVLNNEYDKEVDLKRINRLDNASLRGDIDQNQTFMGDSQEDRDTMSSQESQRAEVKEKFVYNNLISPLNESRSVEHDSGTVENLEKEIQSSYNTTAESVGARRTDAASSVYQKLHLFISTPNPRQTIPPRNNSARADYDLENGDTGRDNKSDKKNLVPNGNQDSVEEHESGKKASNPIEFGDDNSSQNVINPSSDEDFDKTNDNSDYLIPKSKDEKPPANFSEISFNELEKEEGKIASAPSVQNYLLNTSDTTEIEEPAMNITTSILDYSTTTIADTSPSFVTDVLSTETTAASVSSSGFLNQYGTITTSLHFSNKDNEFTTPTYSTENYENVHNEADNVSFNKGNFLEEINKSKTDYTSTLIPIILPQKEDSSTVTNNMFNNQNSTIDYSSDYVTTDGPTLKNNVTTSTTPELYLMKTIRDGSRVTAGLKTNNLDTSNWGTTEKEDTSTIMINNSDNYNRGDLKLTNETAVISENITSQSDLMTESFEDIIAKSAENLSLMNDVDNEPFNNTMVTTANNYISDTTTNSEINYAKAGVPILDLNESLKLENFKRTTEGIFADNNSTNLTSEEPLNTMDASQAQTDFGSVETSLEKFTDQIDSINKSKNESEKHLSKTFVTYSDTDRVSTTGIANTVTESSDLDNTSILSGQMNNVRDTITYATPELDMIETKTNNLKDNQNFTDDKNLIKKDLLKKIQNTSTTVEALLEKGAVDSVEVELELNHEDQNISTNSNRIHFTSTVSTMWIQDKVFEDPRILSTASVGDRSMEYHERNPYSSSIVNVDPTEITPDVSSSTISLDNISSDSISDSSVNTTIFNTSSSNYDDVSQHDTVTTASFAKGEENGASTTHPVTVNGNVYSIYTTVPTQLQEDISNVSPDSDSLGNNSTNSYFTETINYKSSSTNNYKSETPFQHYQIVTTPEIDLDHSQDAGAHLRPNDIDSFNSRLGTDTTSSYSNSNNINEDKVIPVEAKTFRYYHGNYENLYMTTMKPDHFTKPTVASAHHYESDSEEGFVFYLSPVSRHHSQNLPLPSPIPEDLKRENCQRVPEYIYQSRR